MDKHICDSDSDEDEEECGSDGVTGPNHTDEESGTTDCQFCMSLIYVLTVYMLTAQHYKQVICSLHKLIQLVDKRSHEADCTSLRTIRYSTTGCYIIINAVCNNGHVY